ncbi:hypothetical protein CDO73_13060 [Saccharibacillus sp. O23]|uniref:hypothetical protein n=1 Tax=Saccharibacillus sp. O23 TaxID=2009338 RepID=UPI000B4E80EB|nr:hypothetical protein [Saccharibacillus sp. O23]OWR30000.1 hypothetical protein CDO73_13060 [Saccharibacillus sp. O23]
MEFDKTTRIATAVGLIAVLLLLPLKIAVGHPGIYYAVVAAAAIWAGFRLTAGKPSDERFYRRWSRKTQTGKWGTLLAESVKSLILLIAIVASGIMLTGISPRQMLTELTPGLRAGTAALLIMFSVVWGFAGVQEKNRRFARLKKRYEA